MDYQFDSDGRVATLEFDPGPAGTVVSEIGHGFVAEVDVASGRVLSVYDGALVGSSARRTTLNEIISSTEALDAIRRLTFASVFGDEESPEHLHWWLIDRTLARLDLEDVVPGMEVSQVDTDLDSSISTLRDPALEISPPRALRVQAAIDALRRKVPGLQDLPTTGEIVGEALAGEPVGLGVRTDDHGGVGPSSIVPRVILLSTGPDLAQAMTGRLQHLRRLGALDVELVLPMSAAVSVERLACYLVEPDHPQPIAHVSILTESVEPDGQHVLVARFRLKPEEPLDHCEFVVLPAFYSPNSIVRASTARSLLEAEVRLRTAVRLAQKSLQLEALACLADSERAFRDARPAVPRYYSERLRDIRRKIEDDDYARDLLGDL